MTEILIIHLTRLGDLIQSNRLVTELKQSTPGCQIDFFALDEFAGVLQGLPLRRTYTISFEDLQTLHRRLETGATSLWSAGDAIFGGYPFPRYDRILNLDYSRGAAWLTSRIPAGVRQGGQLSQNGDLYFADDWSSYFHAVAMHQNANLFNLVDLQRGAGGAGAFPQAGAPACLATAGALPFALPDGVKVALNPGASEAHRRWPVERYAALARRLQAAGVATILVGAAGDQPACRAIASQLDFPVPDLSGRTTVPEFARLLQMVDLLVSSDTGAVHVASAAGTRIVGIYEHIPYLTLTAPWSAGNLLLRSRLPDRSVDVEVVAEAVLERLGLVSARQLQQALDAAPVEAWETGFLPPGCDPLGGLTCAPRHREYLTAARLYGLVLRHVLAWRFCGAEGPLSVAWLSEAVVSGRLRLSASLCTEAAELANLVVELVERLNGLAGLAHEAGQAAADGDPDRLRQQATQLTTAIDQLPQAPASQPGLQLLMAFLDQKLASTRHLPMAAVLAVYEREFLRCGQILSETLDRLVPVLQRGLAVTAAGGPA